MLVSRENYKHLIGFGVFLTIFLLGFYSAKIYQANNQTIRIYKQGLKDYENENFSNCYYLFSRVGMTSKLKPAALYRQAMCARAVGDKKSELKSYQSLLKNYKYSTLATETKYQAGQLLLGENSKLAKKHFEQVLHSNIDDDYKTASEFYLAKIEAEKLSKNKKQNPIKIKEIESAFRKYLTKFPDGRLAPDVADTWIKFNPKISSKDYTLAAKAYILAEIRDEALKAISKTDIKDSWAIQNLIYYAKADNKKVKEITEEGVSKYSANINYKDYQKAINNYIKTFQSTDSAIDELLKTAKGEGVDYIWNLKCQQTSGDYKYNCYKDLYTNYPSSRYTQTALSAMFFEKIKQKDYANARFLGKDFISKYPDAEILPEVLFWQGKIEQKYHNPESTHYFQKIINEYPDSYYAYRSFWILNGFKDATLRTNIEYKPVMYPYKQPSKNDILYVLMTVNDYEMIKKFSKDKFIQSWAEYEKGNYTTSTHIAQEAMKNIKDKPAKSDLRWRLVYPQNYYIQIRNNAERYNNNPALIISIMREESHFNSEAQSGVGAIGLMQLMPETAHDIGNKNGISFYTNSLFNPELNIKIGNLYYSTIRKMLDNKDVSAIAAYNGGIGSVTKWKNTLKYSDTDEFVEQIPYEETKTYVKKVFRSYWNYLRIYQK